MRERENDSVFRRGGLLAHSTELPGYKGAETELLYKEWLNMDVKILHTDNKLLKRNTHKEYRKYLEKIKSKWEDRTGKTVNCGW
jgi:hypothetical protein